MEGLTGTLRNFLAQVEGLDLSAEELQALAAAVSGRLDDCLAGVTRRQQQARRHQAQAGNGTVDHADVGLVESIEQVVAAKLAQTGSSFAEHFLRLDFDGSGRLSVPEFWFALNGLGIFPRRAEVAALMRRFGGGQDESIDYETFCEHLSTLDPDPDVCLPPAYASGRGAVDAPARPQDERVCSVKALVREKLYKKYLSTAELVRAYSSSGSGRSRHNGLSVSEMRDGLRRDGVRVAAADLDIVLGPYMRSDPTGEVVHVRELTRFVNGSPPVPVAPRSGSKSSPNGSLRRSARRGGSELDDGEDVREREAAEIYAAAPVAAGASAARRRLEGRVVGGTRSTSRKLLYSDQPAAGAQPVVSHADYNAEGLLARNSEEERLAVSALRARRSQGQRRGQQAEAAEEVGDAPVATGGRPGGSGVPAEVQAVVDALAGRGAELARTFREFDTDGSGDLDARELRMGLEVMGVEVPLATCEEVVHHFDRQGDGGLQYSELVRLVQSSSDAERIRSAIHSASPTRRSRTGSISSGGGGGEGAWLERRVLPRLRSAVESSCFELMQLYGMMDRHGRGGVGPEALRWGLSRVGCSLSEEEAALVVEAFGRPGKGQLSRSGFRRLVRG